MAESQPELVTQTEEVTFPSGKTALVVRHRPGARPPQMLASLGLRTPRMVILVLGGADNFDPAARPRVQRLCTLAILPAAVENGAIIVDGGTDTGIMAMIGQAAAEQLSGRPPLLGVAPAARVAVPVEAPAGVPLEPNHTHFVLVSGDQWGGESPILTEVTEALAGGNPVVTILANGGQYARRELMQAVRHKWPVIVLQGSGRLADQVCAPENDQELAEIVHKNRFEIFPIDGEPERLQELISGRPRDDETLQSAWAFYLGYDRAAGVQQRRFRILQALILLLGVVATLLSILYAKEPKFPYLKPALILAPIVTSVLIAFSSQFRQGNKWVLLRAAAGSVLREIFRYRARAGPYNPERCREAPKQIKLQAALQAINTSLYQTDVNLSHVPSAVDLPPAEQLSPLSGDQYVIRRVEDQIGYYERKAGSLERRLMFWRILGYAAGGAGAFLAAVDVGEWVALTTALATAFAAKLEIDQVQNSLVQYNQALSGLRDLRVWWRSLSEWDKAAAKNVDFLVATCEHIIEGEQAGWVQQMQSALEKLRKKDAEAREGS